MDMKTTRKSLIGFVLTVGLLVLTAFPVIGAYKAHNNDEDTTYFLQAYPAAVGTKLDNCYLCHTGGNVGKKAYDSCDYCHNVYGFRPPFGDITKTLNPFGQAYMQAGRNLAAFAAIAAGDADGDGYSNEAEIQAGRLPGDPKDNPAVTEAPAKTYTRAQLRQLPKTTQFMVMDTAKAGDAYCTYGGVDVWTLLQDAGIRDDAANITVFAADGYSKSFAVEDLKKDYAQGLFYTKFPWLRYPLGTAYRHGDQLPGNLRYLLAYEENGYPLQESKIDAVLEKIIGEGPYRFVTPLAQPVAPDRSAWSIDRDDPPYPYNHDRPVIRNGDYCIKAVVAIRVDTAENRSYQYDWNGRAWEMVQNGELAVYGAINP